MKAKTLTKAVKLIDKISNSSSLSSLHKSVEIKANSFRACSEYGNVHILTDEPTGIEGTNGTGLLLETQALLAISSSLPPDDEVTLEEKANHVAWSCDSAKGKLNFVVTDHKIPTIDHSDFPWNPHPNLPIALKLASSACQAAALSFGLYGVTLQPVEDKIQMMSSNTIALACTKIDKGTYPDKKITLRPPVPSIIAALIDACPNCTIDIADNGVFILGDWMMAHLPLGSNLDHDLKGYADKYTETKKSIPINSASLKKFITRAKNLTEKQLSFTVSLKIEEGRLVLEHKGISSSTEQYFLAEGLDQSINYSTVSLSADLLLLPLEHVDSLICDYLSNKQLVLRGSNPEFLYAIGGN